MIPGDLEYLISSLPNVSFQNTEEAKRQVFTVFSRYNSRECSIDDIIPALNIEAGKFISGNELALFENISLYNITDDSFRKSTNSTVSEFAEFNYELRTRIKNLRENRRNAKSGQSDDSGLLSPGNPLEEEVQLMKLQWNKLNELEIEHFADLSALVVYKLKLMILTRWWSFNAEQGSVVLENATQPFKEGGSNG